MTHTNCPPRHTILFPLLLLIVLQGISALFPVQSFAQRTITVTPPRIEHALWPGEQIEGTMSIINDSAEPLTFSGDMRDYMVVDTKGTPNLLPENTLNARYSAASWIGIFPNSFTVLPKERVTLQYVVKVPADAAPGGRYAAAVFTPQTAGENEGSGSSVITQVGSLFVIGIKGPVQEFAQTTKFEAPSFQEFGPVTIDTQIRNFGDAHIRPKGTLVIRDTFGQTIAQVPFEEQNIFPGSARDFTTSFGDQWMAGRYTASLLLSYGTDHNIPLTATLVFWVFPWRAALLTLTGVIALVLFFVYLKKRAGQTNDPVAHE